MPFDDKGGAHTADCGMRGGNAPCPKGQCRITHPPHFLIGE